MIRFISTDDDEDFVLLNKNEGSIRSFVNEGIFGNQVSQRRAFKIEGSYGIYNKIHTVVATENKEYILLFDNKHLHKLSVVNGTFTT
jgi:hypothetical protein